MLAATRIFRHQIVVAATLGVSSLIATPVLAGTDVTWPAGSTQFVISDLVITETLTIEPGVDVLINDGVAIIVQSGGNLVVNGTTSDPVLFTGNGSPRWDGIEFQAGSAGQMSHSIVERTNNVGIRVISAAPLIESCTIRDVRGQGTGAAARGIHVTGAGANPTIHRCLIENVVAADGVQGTNTGAASNGADGADGGLLSNDGSPGGNGSPGAIGGTGTAGGWGYGIALETGAQAEIFSNHIRNIKGGKGGKGGTGGAGGDGGWGGAGYNEVGFLGDGGDGGNGGAGGTGGVGGIGGWAIGLRLWDLPATTTAAQNLVEQLAPGQGGQGGTGGLGGDGGYGGPGVNGAFCFLDTFGGDAGNGGNGGVGGVGGLGGTARAFDAQNGGATVLLVQNTAAAIVVGSGGSSGSSGFGGNNGLGGLGGDCAGNGANGSDGSTGAAGQTGAAGTRNGAFAANVALQLKNNVVTFSGAPSGTALVTSGSGTITAGTNCFFGFSSLSSGSVTVLAGNVLADPMFVDSANFNFHLAASSPAIDSGDNAAVPVGLLADLDDLERLADGDNNASVVVDMGAYEVQPIGDPCPADISPSGGDGIVNVIDLMAVISAWGLCPDPSNCPADLNGDDMVNVIDLLAVISAWGACP